MRAAASDAVAWVCSGAVRTGLLVPSTAGDDSGAWSLTGFGLDVGAGPPVGLAEAIGRWLLDGRPAQVFGPDAPSETLRACDALLVMGDGSSARDEQSPGHLHPGAVPFDDAVLAAIAAGDATVLARLDPDLAAAVGAAGAPAWRRLGQCVASVETATIDARQDPYGVLYFVARWAARWAPRA